MHVKTLSDTATAILSNVPRYVRLHLTHARAGLDSLFCWNRHVLTFSGAVVASLVRLPGWVKHVRPPSFGMADMDFDSCLWQKTICHLLPVICLWHDTTIHWSSWVQAGNLFLLWTHLFRSVLWGSPSYHIWWDSDVVVGVLRATAGPDKDMSLLHSITVMSLCESKPAGKRNRCDGLGKHRRSEREKGGGRGVARVSTGSSWRLPR